MKDGDAEMKDAEEEDVAGKSNEMIVIDDDDDDNNNNNKDETVMPVENERSKAQSELSFTMQDDDDDDVYPTDSIVPNFRVTRNKGGRSQGRTLKQPSSKTTDKNAAAEAVLHKLMEEAKYEIEQDSFRGIRRYMSKEDATNISPSPWEISCSPSMNSLDDDEGKPLAEQMTLWASHSNCPSLIEWTLKEIRQQSKQKKGRKRKFMENFVFSQKKTQAIGKRPVEDGFRCRCDYNPFCIATLGGAMDDVLRRDLCLHLGQKEPAANSSDDSSGGRDDNDDDEEISVVDKPDEKYRPKIRERVKAVRKKVWVETSRIRAHLKQTLSRSPEESFIQLIREYHRHLCFENPLDDDEVRGSDRIKLSVPPGIENLGATCYLNTQLQCLAQNTVFLNGIFSWEVGDKRDKMTAILEKFQALLATMNGGSASTCNTLEFSNALGLDHFEQQDPNEFSKLFFDKLHQNFQQQGESAGKGKCDLSGLLPLLFQGVIRYETTCLKCGNVSVRKEEFMDQNLPIASFKEKGDKKKKKGKAQTLLEGFCSSEADCVDVQFCWDQSNVVETFEGENQYSCSACNCKQDATRCTKFEKLPHILNVQLGRYQFDLASFSKKKVQDKVLLSRELLVTSEEEQNGSTQQKKYILCAVMKHLGKSAQSGHYIAEAMDWATGLWYEFNDEKVQWQKSGPSNSPSGKGENADGKGQKKKVEGSNSAYGMFYVEEGFLAQSILDFFKQLQQPPADLPSILCQTAKERKRHYAELSQSCLEDCQIQQQLRHRRKLIVEKVFPRNHWKSSQSDGYVWIDGDFLRRFMSCDDSFEAELKNGDFLSKITSPGNDPRVVRRGKLVSHSTFHAIQDILVSERRRLSSSSPLEDFRPSHVTFPVDSDAQNEYISDLSKKRDRLEEVLRLYRNFENSKFDKEHSESDKHEQAYLVGKKFVASFRSVISGFIKKVGSADGDADKSIMDKATGVEAPCEGLDSIDVTSLVDWKNQRDLDTSVNNNLACVHNNCSKNIKSRSVRYLRKSDWLQLKSIFPDAISLEVDRTETFPKCKLCESNDATADALSGLLQHLAKQYSESKVYEALDCDTILKNEKNATYRLVRLDDLEAIRKFSKYFAAGAKMSDTKSFADKIGELMLPGHKSSASQVPDNGHECEVVGRKFVDSFFSQTPLVCKEHCLPLHESILVDESTPNTSLDGVLHKRVAVIGEEHYSEFLTVVAALGVLGEMCSGNVSFEDLQYDNVIKKAEALKDTYNLEKTPHPTVVEGRTRSEGNSPLLLGKTEKSLCVEFSLNSKTCKKISCCAIFQSQERSHKKDYPADAEVINLVEPSSSMKLSVVRIEEDTSMEKVLESLSKSLGLPLKYEQNVRRSSRRRRLNGNDGVLLSEETIRCDLENNLASLRLLLIERASNFDLHNVLKLVAWPKEDSSGPAVFDVDAPEESIPAPEPVTSELPFSLNETSLKDIFEKEFGFNISDLSDYEGRVFIVHSDAIDPSSVEISNEAIFDHLMGQSDAVAPESKRSNGKRKSHKPEKGFTGTFLSSFDDGNDEEKNFASSGDKNLSAKDSGDSTPPPRKSAMKTDSPRSSQSDELVVPKRARFADEKEVGFSKVHAFVSERKVRTSTETDSDQSDLDRAEETTDLNDGDLPIEVTKRIMKEYEDQIREETVAFDAASHIITHNPTDRSVRSLADKAFAYIITLEHESNRAKAA